MALPVAGASARRSAKKIMSLGIISGGLLLSLYTFAWWAGFYLLLRRSDVFRMLCWLPAAICAFGIPMLFSDATYRFERITLQKYLYAWALVPVFLSAGILLIARRKAQGERKAEQD